MIWLLIGYMWLFIHRPFEIYPALGEIHLERVYMIGLLTAAAVYPGKRWLPDWHHLAFFAFAGAVGVAWLLSPYMDAGLTTVDKYFKTFVFYVLIVVLVHDEKTLRWLVLGLLAVTFVYMLHSLKGYFGGRYHYRMGIFRMIGVDESLGDPNAFGASIVYTLPFLVPFWRCRPGRLLRLFLIGYAGLAMICIALTGSRSSFMGLLAWGMITAGVSRWRWQLATAGVLLAPLLWFALPESLQNRFTTIIDPSVGPENAQVSAHGRVEGVLIGLRLFAANPLSGCGPGAWIAASGSELKAHNLLGQLLGEMGLVGAVPFAAILLGFLVNTLWVRRTYRRNPHLGKDFLFHLAGAIGVAVLLLLLLGVGGHNLFRFSWLWYGAFLIITRHCVRQRLAAWQPRPARRPLVRRPPPYGRPFARPFRPQR